MVREGGTPDGAKVIELRDEPFAHAIEIRNLFERAPLALLRPLPVSRMKQRHLLGAVALQRDGRTDAGIHPPAQKHHCFSLIRSYHHCNRSRCALYP